MKRVKIFSNHIELSCYLANETILYDGINDNQKWHNIQGVREKYFFIGVSDGQIVYSGFPRTL